MNSDGGFNVKPCKYRQPNGLMKLGFNLNTQLQFKRTRMEIRILKHRVDDMTGSERKTY